MGLVVQIQRTISYSVIECCLCGVEFAVNIDLETSWRKQGEKASFYCPNGHVQSFKESEADRVRRELQGKLVDANRAREWWQVRAKQKDRTISNLKGQATKLRKRLAHGVCPCCHRTFKQLAAHMKSQHPDYAAPPVETSDTDAE